MKEMTIKKTAANPSSSQIVVLLKEKGSKRYLPILVGPSEADSIVTKLQEINLPRPLVPDLLLSVIEHLNATVHSVIIDDIRDNIIYGEIVLDVIEKRLIIDSRPSDAIALAVKAKVPIFAEDDVLDIAGLSGRDYIEDRSEDKIVGESDLKNLSVHTNFIDTVLNKSGRDN